MASSPEQPLPPEPVPGEPRHDAPQGSAPPQPVTVGQPLAPSGEPGSDRQPTIDFEPAVLRYRHDGWTAERQIAFIEKLAVCGSVSAACRHVGMSRELARELYLRPSGRAFRDAWDVALDCAYAEVEETAMERARDGTARPVFYQGVAVGEWRFYDERLTMFLLRFRRRHRFGPEADSLPAPPSGMPGYDPDEPHPFDPEDALDGALDGIEFAPEPPPGEDEEDGLDGQ